MNQKLTQKSSNICSINKFMLKAKNKIVIGIPTYKRNIECINLVRQLSSIDGIFDLAEIIIIDNHNDKGQHLKKKLAKLKLNEGLTYLVNEKNIGLDGSILKMTKLAIQRDTSLWFLSDDDKIYSHRVLDFLKHISSSNKPVNLCIFDYDQQNYKNVLRKKKYHYLRASFLPTVAINPKKLSLSNLNYLIGTNYIHIAIVNSLIQGYEDISIYSSPLGIQSKNEILTFNISQTFIKGYYMCMLHENIFSKEEIMKETTIRSKGYLGVTIKNIYKKNIYVNFEEIKLLVKTIYKYLGLKNLMKLFDRIFIIFFLSIFFRKS